MNRNLYQLLFALLVIGHTAAWTGTVQAGDLRIQINDAESGMPLVNAIVEVLLPEALQTQYQTAGEALVDQQQKEFVDAVTVVTKGSRIGFPNSDDILHHVYSFSDAKVFELPLYGSGQTSNYQEAFDVAGVVELGCNIHDWMLAHIYVAETDFAVKTDSNGTAVLSNIPAGNYSVRVWHPRVSADDPALLQQLSIDEQGTAQLRMALTLQRDSRLRRAPGPGRSRYR